MLESEALCIEEAENCISSAEDNIADLECRLADTENKLAALTNRMDDPGARSQRDNICPNSSTWKPRKARSGWTGATEVSINMPRVVIMKFHYPADKMKIQALGVKQKLKYEGTRISIRKRSCSNGGASTSCAKS